MRYPSAEMFDADVCYRALAAKDRRFDGLFFVGVETTGIYCRPVCTARTPRRDRCSFYASSAQAEQAGFRACFVCRPELAPGASTVDATERLVRDAVAHVDAGFLNDHSVDELADRLGVTARHLRRATNEALGVTPVELAQTRRLALAKQLLQDTSMSLADVAFAAGFSSVRRFNASFAERFAMPPSEVRRRAPGGADETLRLDFRPPLAWASLLDFLRVRAIPGVERVDDGYARVVAFGDDVGTIHVTRDPKRAALRVGVSGTLMPHLMRIVSRVRALFDLDARPDAIGERLGADHDLAAAVALQPGLRIPGAFDPFETLVRTVLGQQVSVKGATTLAGRFVERYGERIGEGPLSHRFPPPERIARATGIARAVGLPKKRADTLRAVARAAVDGVFATTDVERFTEALLAIPGVGPWTASYAAMRVLHHPDAFPAADLGITKTLGVKTAREATDRAENWRPWRAYAAMYLWSTPATTKES